LRAYTGIGAKYRAVLIWKRIFRYWIFFLIRSCWSNGAAMSRYRTSGVRLLLIWCDMKIWRRNWWVTCLICVNSEQGLQRGQT